MLQVCTLLNVSHAGSVSHKFCGQPYRSRCTHKCVLRRLFPCRFLRVLSTAQSTPPAKWSWRLKIRLAMGLWKVSQHVITLGQFEPVHVCRNFCKCMPIQMGLSILTISRGPNTCMLSRLPHSICLLSVFFLTFPLCCMLNKKRYSFASLVSMCMVHWTRIVDFQPSWGYIERGLLLRQVMCCTLISVCWYKFSKYVNVFTIVPCEIFKLCSGAI